MTPISPTSVNGWPTVCAARPWRRVRSFRRSGTSGCAAQVQQTRPLEVAVLSSRPGTGRLARRIAAVVTACCLLAAAAAFWQTLAGGGLRQPGPQGMEVAETGPPAARPAAANPAPAAVVDPLGGLEGVTDAADLAAQQIGNLVDAAVDTQQWAYLDHNARQTVETLAARLPFDPPLALLPPDD